MASVQYVIYSRAGSILGNLFIRQEMPDQNRYALLLDVFEETVSEEFPAALSDRNIARILLSQIGYNESFVMRELNQIE